MNTWRAANNGNGKRMWFLIRTDESVPVSERYHYNGRGDLIRYASYKTAQYAADNLNSQATARTAAHWTDATDRQADEFYATLSESEIRRRQGLCEKQMKLAAEQGNERAMADLQRMSDALMGAMLARC
jgi:hypothetical protein